MTLRQLEQYKDLLQEAKLWERELQALKRKAGGVVKDTVRGSSPDYPYTEHPVTITGVLAKTNRRILRRENRLKERRKRLEAQLDEIDKFIDSLEDSQLRQIIQYRYIDDFSWVKTARLVNNKESTVKMRVLRFFKTCDVCDEK